jgi:hypothetical protein
MIVVLVSVVPRATATSVANVPTGIMIPLYSYPGSTWSEVVTAKTTYPAVPFVAVINPSNGPGRSFDANYLTGTEQLLTARVIVLGYVYTDYARTPLSRVEAQVNTYWNWYHVNGIMFDGMANGNGHQSYYSNLNSYVKSLGMTYTVGNPGTTTLASYVGTLDALNIYENSALPTATSIQSATFNGAYSNSNFGMIAYGVSLPTQAYIASISSYVAWVYFTDATSPNPYGTLPTYFMSEVQMLNSDIVTTTTTTA